jgi:hypothetical protein
MISPQNQSPNVIDSLDGTLSEWYNSIDGALRASEVIPGEYEYTVNVSYGSQCPIQMGGTTNIDIMCERFKCISLDNSFIECEQMVDFQVNKLQSTATFNGKRYYYIGHKDSFDSLINYKIYSNGDHVQTVNNCNYESLLLNYATYGDYSKEKADTQATYDKVQKMSPHVPGIYLDLSLLAANTNVRIVLNYRIPLNKFLLIKNLRWYPGWMGKLTLEMQPSNLNLVWCPIFPEGRGPTISGTVNQDYGFVPFGDPAINYVTYATGTYSAPVAQTFTITNSYWNQCKIRMAQYMLNMEVYNALSMKYLEVPLLFPIQEVKSVKFSQQLQDSTSNQVAESLTASTTINHCDSMFIVFPRTVNDRVTFINPELTQFQINIDGKLYPRDRYATVDDVKFTNMVYDAMNVNNNVLLSISEDVANSLQPYRKIQTSTDAGVLTASNVYIMKDRSNFMIGIPFTNDEDFMGGIHNLGTAQIQIQLTKAQSANAPYFKHAPVAIFLEDCILKIRSMKPPGTPQITITHATIEQIQMGAL